MQDKAFVQIGKLVLKDMGNKEPYELFIQNMFPEKDNYKMIVAVFEVMTVDEQLVCTFKNIDSQNVSVQNFQKYAYRKGSARGGDITFTTKFGDIEKKFRTLVDGQFKNVVNRLSNTLYRDEYLIFYSVHQFLKQKENFDKVKKELSSFYDNISKEERNTSGLSLMFNIDGEEKYLSDFKIIQQILSASGTEEKSEKYGVTSEGANSVCAVCLQNKLLLHGFASPFKYATVDKPGMVSGFFKQVNNWKNYPICTDCSLELELGRAYVTQNLNNYFYGKAYYTIPKTILNKDTNDLEKVLRRLKELYTNISEDGQKIKFKEDSLQRMIAQEKDYFNLNLLFYEENPTTKAIKIKLMLEEIMPSRFRKLFVDVPEKINGHSLYQKAIYEGKVLKDLKFSFGVLKTFFEEDFHELIQKVFMNIPIAEEALYKKFINVIHQNYNKGYSLNQTVLKAHLAIRYFQELKLLPIIPIITNMDIPRTYSFDKKTGFDPERINKFLEENEQFLSSNAKKGIFFLGVMVKHLLNVQYTALDGNTPFEKKLKGYNLSATSLQKVYQEAFGKLDQYKEKYGMPTTLLDFVNKYFILHFSEVKKMSSNEASFYFVSGTQFIDKMKFPKEDRFENKENKSDNS